MIPKLITELLKAGVKIHLEYKDDDTMPEPGAVFVISGPSVGPGLEFYEECPGVFEIHGSVVTNLAQLVKVVSWYWKEKEPLLKEWEELFRAHNLIKEKQYYVKST